MVIGLHDGYGIFHRIGANIFNGYWWAAQVYDDADGDRS
jgi:hypothetical protein